MHRGRAGGFTLAEVVVALLLVAVGVLALAASSGQAVRMVGWGRWSTAVAQVAAARAGWLRGLAASTRPPCADPRLVAGSALTAGIGERWELSPLPGASRVTLVLEHRRPGGPVADTVMTALLCR